MANRRPKSPLAKTTLSVEALEDRALMAFTTRIVLDFTPDHRSGAFIDTFILAQQQLRAGDASALVLDITGDSRLGPDDFEGLAYLIGERTKDFFAPVLKKLGDVAKSVKFKIGDLYGTSLLGYKQLKKGKMWPNMQVQVMYLGGSNISSYDTIGLANLAPKGKNVEGYSDVYTRTIYEISKGRSAQYFIDTVASTAAHELGHMYGLDHTERGINDIMAAYATNKPGRTRFYWDAIRELRKSFTGQPQIRANIKGEGTFLMAPGSEHGHAHGHEHDLDGGHDLGRAISPFTTILSAGARNELLGSPLIVSPEMIVVDADESGEFGDVGQDFAGDRDSGSLASPIDRALQTLRSTGVAGPLGIDSAASEEDASSILSAAGERSGEREAWSERLFARLTEADEDRAFDPNLFPTNHLGSTTEREMPAGAIVGAPQDWRIERWVESFPLPGSNTMAVSALELACIGPAPVWSLLTSAVSEAGPWSMWIVTGDGEGARQGENASMFEGTPTALPGEPVPAERVDTLETARQDAGAWPAAAAGFAVIAWATASDPAARRLSRQAARGAAWEPA